MLPKPLAWMALGAALILACSDRLAGGYDDVENPALALALKDNQGQAIAVGEVRVYARYQNPTSDSLPLLVRATSTGDTLTLSDTAMNAAIAEAKLRGMTWPNPDVFEFNVVGRSSSHEAFTVGFQVVREKTKLRFQQWLNANILRDADRRGRLNVGLNLKAAVLNYQGKIGDQGRELGLKSIFVAGSPYQAATRADGSFTMARIGSGQYEIKAMSQDGKVYSAENALNTDSSYTGENWSEADVIWIEQ